MNLKMPPDLRPLADNGDALKKAINNLLDAYPKNSHKEIDEALRDIAEATVPFLEQAKCVGRF